MSMQLFSFGHPCEHQLRRTCIGGSSCPLNGYPDAWCCSYIKGKINFKRDKPCEGPRCRWGFTHPSHQQFEEVTQVLNDSRPIAAKIDEAEDGDLLNFHTDSPHIVDTVQCALHMLRHPPSSCARRVGQLMAYGAVKSGDAKVFMHILKTMKKPVDNYILGAFVYLTQGTPPNPTAGPNSAHNATSGATSANKAGKKSKTELPKKEDVVQDLRNDLVDIMNAALGHAGHLVDREDQHLLQATFIQALRQYPKSNKRRQDMLEAAVQCFGNRQVPKEAPADATAAATESTSDGVASAPAVGAAAATASTTAPSTPGGAATPLGSPEGNKARTSPALDAAVTAAVATPPRSPTTASTLSAHRLPTLAEAAAAALEKATVHHATGVVPPSSTTAAASAPATTGASAAPVATAPAAPPAPAHTTSTSATAAVAPAARSNTLTISRIAQLHAAAPRPLTYDPLRVDEPLPNVFLAGGLFALSPSWTGVAPLGSASVQVRLPNPPMIVGSRTASDGAQSTSTSANVAAVASELHQTLFGLGEPVFEHFDAEKMFAPGDDVWNS